MANESARLPSRILTIARNAFREAVRDRILYNLILFVLLITASAVFLGDLSGGQEARVIVNLGLSTTLIFGTFISIFVGVSLVWKEIEKKTVYSIFSKPIGRGEFIVGKYLGLCSTLLVNVLVMGLGVTLALLYVGGGELAWKIWPAVALIFLELTITTAVAIMFSSFSTPALSALLTFFVFVIGNFSASLRDLGQGLTSSVAKTVLDVMYYVLPNLSQFSFITETSNGMSAPTPMIGGSLLYAVLYDIILLTITVVIFKEAELQMIRDIVLPAVIIVVGFLAVFRLSGYLEGVRPALPDEYVDSDLTVRGSKLKGFAFGTEGLIADYYYIRSLQYVGDKLVKSKSDFINLDDLRSLNPRLLYPLLDNATDLDPHFIAAYSYGSVVLPAIDPAKAVRLASKGIANNPTEWRLYQHLGYIYWKIGNFEKAAETYERGAEVPGASPFMRLMAASMKTRGGSRETAREIFNEMLASSDDEQVQITAKRRLDELDSLDERDALNNALADFNHIIGRCPNNFAEITHLLMQSGLPAGHEFRVDRANNIVDPSGAPYLLDREKCIAILDASKTGIALK